MRLGRKLLIVAVLVALVAVASVGVGAAQTAKAPTTLPGLLKAFGIDRVPGDFVVVIDTSGSMSVGPNPPYPIVKRAIPGFIRAMGDADRLSLLTFDSVPNLIFNGPLKTDKARAQAIAAIPARADGNATDIGAALAAVLDRLETPLASRVQVVFFLTDGIHEPAGGSRYPTTTGAAWRALRARANRLYDSRRLVVYGAGLSGGARTDISLVRSVFADAQLQSLPAGQLADLFKEIILKAQTEKLKDPLAAELKGGKITVEPVQRSAGLSARTTVGVRLRSTFDHLAVSVDLTGVEIGSTMEGTTARLVGDAKTVTVQPGGVSETIEIEVLHPNLSGGLPIRRKQESDPIKLSLKGTAHAQPADVIRRDVGLNPDRVLLAGSANMTLTRSVGIGGIRVAIAALIALAIIGLISYLLWKRFQPSRVHGRLHPEDGGPAVELRGRRVTVPPGSATPACALFTKPGQPGIVFASAIDGRVVRVGGQVLTEDAEILSGDRIECEGYRATWESLL